MIVVLIIGILLTIAVPNFIIARETSRAKCCVANLKQIDSAKQQAIMDYKLSISDTTSQFFVDGTTANAPGGTNGKYQLVGNQNSISVYIRRPPICPSGGVYSPGGVTVSPTCSVTGAVGSGYAPSEKWWHGY